jgi:mono/diheme cytochrome c family protein
VRAVRIVLLPLLVGVATADPAAEAGRALFVGARAFQNGGPPCGACHALGGEGLAFTASLGPELATGLVAMDAAGLDGLLETLPFPTMTPLYDAHALTPAERADLATYLLAAAKQGPPRDAWRFELLGTTGAGVLFVWLALAWRRRKPPSRGRLLARAHHSPGGTR